MGADIQGFGCEVGPDSQGPLGCGVVSAVGCCLTGGVGTRRAPTATPVVSKGLERGGHPHIVPLMRSLDPQGYTGPCNLQLQGSRYRIQPSRLRRVVVPAYRPIHPKLIVTEEIHTRRDIPRQSILTGHDGRDRRPR